MKITKIEKLDPRVWGVTINFKVIKKNDIRTVNFKDGSEHKVCDILVGDDSATIIFSLWDEHISKVNENQFYQINEARMNVFNNSMKLTMSKKSELKKIDEEFVVNEKENMSEKKFKPINSPFLRKRNYYKK